MLSLYFEIYRDTAHLYRWRLKSPNGKIIADSGEGYFNKVDCLHGIDLVKSTNSSTPVSDTTNTVNGLQSLLSRGARMG